MRVGAILLLGACAADDPPAAPDPDAPLELVRTWGGYGTGPGQFVEPSSVELDSAGFVYVAGHEDRVQKFTRDGELVTIWGTSGTGEAQFDHPHGLAIDRARGDLVYVGDQENHRVQVFQPDTSFVLQWSNLKFQHIHDVGIDPATGDIFVGDYDVDVLQRFTAGGQLVAQIGGPGTGPGQFQGIWGISTDAAGNVYVADTFNQRIQKLASDGTFLAEWRAHDGVAFVKPTGVFVDARQVVYVCDSLAEMIVLFDVDGNVLERWDMRGILGAASEPEDIVLDPTGEHIYVVEVREHRVHYLRPR